MPNLREIKVRLRGVRKTRQITRAMKMVATVKLRHAQMALANARPYAERMRELAANVLASAESLAKPGLAGIDSPALDNPFFVRRENRRILVVIVATDRGLCGNMNGNVFRQALRFVDGLNLPKQAVELLLIGRKAKDHFKSRESAGLDNSYRLRDYVPFGSADAVQLGKSFCGLYRDGTFDRVDLFYNESFSALQHRQVHCGLLPLDMAAIKAEGSGKSGNFVFEPDGSEMLDDVICGYVVSAVQRIFKESEVAENAARMLMMDLATKNADSLISEMQMDMNKLRQLVITTELADITTGMEALG